MTGNEGLEILEEYIYLGQKISTNPGHKKEIRRKVEMKWSTFGKHTTIMNSNLPLSIKRKAYNHCILPLQTYGSEIWSLTKERKKNWEAHKGEWRKNAGHNMTRWEANIIDQETYEGWRYISYE